VGFVIANRRDQSNPYLLSAVQLSLGLWHLIWCAVPAWSRPFATHQEASRVRDDIQRSGESLSIGRLFIGVDGDQCWVEFDQPEAH
jgi:hypothetical protein